MKGLPKDKRNRVLLVGLGTVVALGILWFLLINPLRLRLAAIRGQGQAVQRQIADADRLLRQAEAVLAELEESRQHLEEIEAGMAPADKFTWINLLLNRFRLPYQVEISEFGQPAEGEVEMIPRFPYKAATFTIRGQGFFHDLGRFFADFENSFPYLRLQNLDLEPSSSTNPEDQEKLTFKVDIVALVKPTAPR